MNEIRRKILGEFADDPDVEVIDPLTSDDYYIEDKSVYWMLPEAFDSAVIGMEGDAVVYDRNKVFAINNSDEYDGPDCGFYSSVDCWSAIMMKHDMAIDSCYRGQCPIFVELF